MEAPGHVRSCDTPKNDEDPLVEGVFAMERTTGFEPATLTLAR